MGYVEERIKYLAVQHWQRDKHKHELTCGNDQCDGRYPLTPRMDSADTGPFVVLECEDCDRIQTFIPNPVIDAFLARL